MGNKIINESYNLSIVAKHFQITDAIRNYVFEKLSKVERVADHIIDVMVTLDAQKLEQSCSILMNFIHFHIKVQASTDNIYSAIDKAVSRLVQLIRKYKTKMQSRRFKDLTSVDIHVNVIEGLKDDLKSINEDIDDENARQKQAHFEMHKVIAQETIPLKTLRVDEALMKMEISDRQFLIFRAEEDQKLRVIYRRPDQNYGLVQIQS